MWKLSWFFRDFGYGAELLGKNEIDDKALVDLWGVVKVKSPFPASGRLDGVSAGGRSMT